MRAQCPSCGSSTALGEYICFKCSYAKNWTKSDIFTEQKHTIRSTVLELRDDITLNPQEFHTKALQWLYKAGLYDDDIKRQSIAYCKTIDKVLIPAFDSSNKLRFYQLRSLVEDDKRKYITYGRTSEYTIKYLDHPESDRIVICEDHLSGIRLRKHCNVLCLSGTSMNKGTVEQLLSEFNTFIFWLDADEPGRKAMYNNLGRIKWCSQKANVSRMFSDKAYRDYKYYRVDYKTVEKDPKFYLDNEIKNILNTKVIKL